MKRSLLVLLVGYALGSNALFAAPPVTDPEPPADPIEEAVRAKSSQEKANAIRAQAAQARLLFRQGLVTPEAHAKTMRGFSHEERLANEDFLEVTDTARRQQNALYREANQQQIILKRKPIGNDRPDE